jgi:hypothetical protein
MLLPSPKQPEENAGHDQSDRPELQSLHLALHHAYSGLSYFVVFSLEALTRGKLERHS